MQGSLLSNSEANPFEHACNMTGSQRDSLALNKPVEEACTGLQLKDCMEERVLVIKEDSKRNGHSPRHSTQQYTVNKGRDRHDMLTQGPIRTLNELSDVYYHALSRRNSSSEISGTKLTLLQQFLLLTEQQIAFRVYASEIAEEEAKFFLGRSVFISAIDARDENVLREKCIC
jgi:hypothetical protein